MDSNQKTEKESLLINEYEIQIADIYKLNAKKKLGSGAFGDIYYGIFFYYSRNKHKIKRRSRNKIGTNKIKTPSIIL